VRLTEEQSRALLAKHGVYVMEACDQCGKILGHVRFTRFGQSGEWCSRECRDGTQVAERYRGTRKGGRPQNYQTDRERKTAKRQQDAIAQRAYRERRSVRKNPLVSDSFQVITKRENQPLAIPIAGERV
jgi:hypothetical protein